MHIWDDIHYDWSNDTDVQNEEMPEDDCLSDEQEYEMSDDQSYYFDTNVSYYEEENIEMNSDEILSCDTCDRQFYDQNSFEKHMSEHITCNIDGCTFTAHQKIVDKHVSMQHSTGLYDKIRNISTPEDIKKWIEDRKRKYPSKENIEKRRLQQEKLLQRGERLTASKDRFGRKQQTRFQKPQHSKFKNPTENIKPKRKINRFKQNLKKSLIDDKCDWNGNMFPFRGTSSLICEEEDVKDDFDDAEWAEEKLVVNNNKSKNKLVLNNALGALMGAYNSSDESDTEKNIKINKPQTDIKLESVVKEEINVVVKEEIKVVKNSDDEAPTEEKVKRETEFNVTSQEKESFENKIQPNGQNRLKRERKRNHKAMNKVETSKNESNVPFLQRKFKRRRRTLLEGLLENDIRHERNVILQCIRYVVENNFFINK